MTFPMDSNVEIIDCEGGDWSVLKVNGNVEYEGHSIPQHEWLKLLVGFNISVARKVISDQDMEEGNY